MRLNFVYKFVFLFVLIASNNAYASSCNDILNIDMSNVRQGTKIEWFAGIKPGDDIITTWCKLQKISGDIKFNLWFSTSGVGQTWDTNLQKKERTAEQIIELLQSLIPTQDGKINESQQYAQILKNVVQAEAKSAPNGEPIGFSSKYYGAKELLLWEPLIIGIKPVNLENQQFKLLITLKPNLGAFVQSLHQQILAVKLKGWKGRLSIDNFSDDCSVYIPECKDIPEIASFYAPWVVDSISLVAEGENMNVSAGNIFNQLMIANNGKTIVNYYEIETGRVAFNIDDSISEVSMKTELDEKGVKKIEINWNTKVGFYKYYKDIEIYDKLNGSSK